MKRKKIKNFLKVAAGIFVATAVAQVIFMCFIVGLNDTLEPADAILVLGTKVEENGHPSPRLKARLDRGKEVYNQGWADVIVVSGGMGKEGFYEAEAMKRYLVAKGIDPQKIYEDRKAKNTFENVQGFVNYAKEKEWKSVIVVSDYFHLLRAKLTLHRMGVKKVYGAYSRRAFVWRDIFFVPREVAAFYAYLFRKVPPLAT